MVSNMKAKNFPHQNLCLIIILIVPFLTGCGDNGITSQDANIGINSQNASVALRASYTAPLDGATLVAKNTKLVVLFNESFNVETGTYSFNVKGSDETPLTGNVTFDAESNSVSFSPTGFLSDFTEYTATLTTVKNGTEAVTVWKFTSSNLIDSINPSLSTAVTPTSPANNAIEVAVNGRIGVLFDEELDPASVNSESLILTVDGENVDGVVSYANNLISFKPSSNLADNTLYQVTLTTGITDLANNGLGESYVWSFTSGTIVAKGPAPVALRTAEDFTILAKAGLTNTGNHITQITGNIGASPITAAFMDEVYCPEMTNGTIYGVDLFYAGGTGGIACFLGNAFAKTKVDVAILDLGVAYTDAAGRASPDHSEFGAGILGGEILVPGLYKWGTNVVISDDITLHGSDKDVWIFQISGNMSLSGKKSVLLTGGALAKNVFWQLTENVALGENAHLVGVVLAKTHISLWPNASVEGRLFSQTQVTLQDNSITAPN
jgi:hypothetical protein